MKYEQFKLFKNLALVAGVLSFGYFVYVVFGFDRAHVDRPATDTVEVLTARGDTLVLTVQTKYPTTVVQLKRKQPNHGE